MNALETAGVISITMGYGLLFAHSAAGPALVVAGALACGAVGYFRCR